MRRAVIVDTGPLVAFLNRRDTHHGWAQRMLAEIEPPLLTCEAVLSEACFLVRKLDGGAWSILQLVARGLVTTPFRLAEETTRVQALLKSYANVPMSLADACLVAMAERHSKSTVLTTDSDFTIYRKNGRQAVPALLPE